MIKVADKPATDRIIFSIRQQARRIDGEVPTPNQIAMVLHALADYTMNVSMLKHRPDTTSPLIPEANSIGRWFHDVGDEFEDTMDEISLCSNCNCMAKTVISMGDYCGKCLSKKESQHGVSDPGF